jgi:elongation factor P
MNTGTYDQIDVPLDLVEDDLKYFKEGDTVIAQSFDGKVIGIDLPKNMPLRVSYTENAVRGDTSSAITKDAQLETGLAIKVPAFIKTGDVVSVNTETGQYRERVK